MIFKKEWCRLKYFNIAFFASIMWFWGLTLATHKLEKVFQTWTNYSEILLYFTLVYFIIVLIAYLLKVIINFDDVRQDFKHPVKSNFFPWIWKIFLIFSIWFLAINIDLAKYLWAIWVIIQFFFSIVLFRRWILHEQDIKTMNPLWFLPIVWNLLAPIAWVPLGFVELSWFFFSIGFVMWVVMFTVIMNRIIFHNPLPWKLMPTLFILVAPGSVVAIAYTVLNNWELSDFSRIVFYFSVFIFIMIISKINVLSKLRFFMSWWAYSFPMAVLTNATLMYYTLTWNVCISYLAIFFYIILILLILWLFYRTIIWMKRKELCIEE